MILKRSIGTAMLASAVLVVFGACGDDSEPTRDGAANGEACADGSECQSALCFIAVSGEPGECREVPASCNGEPSCIDSPCLDEVKDECPGGTSCLGIASTYTIECSTPIGDGGGGPGGGSPGGAGGGV